MTKRCINPMPSRAEAAALLPGMAKKLGGEVHGNLIFCPGPGRDPSDRSLVVTLNEFANELAEHVAMAASSVRALH